MPSSSPLSDASTRRRIGPWHPDRRASLDDFEAETNFLVRAAAGSGKTTALIARMVALVRQGVPLSDCAAITFTRKAAGEMQARLYAELRRTQDHLRSTPSASTIEQQRVASALSSLPRCFIGTIHAFCTRLLRERPLAAGLPPDFSAGLDSREQEEQRRHVWQSYLSDVWNTNPEQVDRVVSLGIQPADLAHFFGELCRYPDLSPFVDGPDTPPNLDDAVAKIADNVERWVSGLPADPGDGNAKPGTAASTLRTAQRMLEVYPMTDPATRAEFIDLFDGITKRDGRKSTETTVRGDITKSHWQDEDLATRLDNELLPELAREVIQPALHRWRAYAHKELVEFVRPAVSLYAQHRRNTGRLTFQDLLVCTRDLLRDAPEARRALQEQYPRLLVDEFQDTDPIQAEILFYLASQNPSEQNWRKCRPRDGSLFVVGDDKQSIYRFRRADLDVYSTVRSLIEQAPNGEDVVLKSNFRSAPSLLDWCNDTFRPLFDEQGAPYQATYVPFTPARSDAGSGASVLQLKVPYEKGSSSTRQIARRNADQIASLIAQACRHKHTDSPSLVGTSPGDFMVLTRNTTRLDEFAEAFAANDLPYTLAGGDDVDASPELFAMVTMLTCIERPQDPVARLAYLRGPLVGLSDDHLYRFRKAGGEFEGPFQLSPDVMSTLSPSLSDRLRRAYAHLRQAADLLAEYRPASALEQIIERLGLMARTRRDRSMGSLHAGRLLRVLTEVQRLDADGHTWTAIRDELQQILDEDHSLDGLTLETGATEAVRLLNVHKAKGLEAPVVFLADPYGGPHPKPPDEHVRRDEGDVVLPIYEKHRYNRSLRFAPEKWETAFKDTEAQYQRAEEDRLLYVAATRAEDQLVVSRYRSPSWSHEKGYWAPLYDGLSETPIIDVPDGPVEATERSSEHVPRLFAPSQREQAERPTYFVTSVTETVDRSAGPSGSTGYGREFGNAMHRLFEYVIERRHAQPLSTEKREKLLETILDDHEAMEYRTVGERMLTTFLKSTLWTALCSAQTVHTELSVSDQSQEPPVTLTEGTIDLIYSPDGTNWHLVDFKTDQVPPEGEAPLRNRYRAQLQHYTKLWEAATGEHIEKKTLWLADAGRSVSIGRSSSTE